ncbi:MAG: type II toxin-antitoxin system HigB family toxin [Reyranella sp.]|uniref:type II toxin-antitoxin system HigB family toxin n=1 Tax=Reyranella sp. TaxID=1929291 RepID=UPI001ACD2077|nr:type II toxin-antitoxin system HigB family toxin [Reyranella sp.]MBN9090806.1 type II toxin-antitoxin system HigB family toxin [Reyranella sp.]
MQIIAKRTLREFWLRHPAAETPLKLWYARAARARWLRPSDLRAQFGSTVDFVPGNRAIFDIGGNKYRLIVKIDYSVGLILVRFIGLHSAYDRIDPATI